ncbi:hypothetical protein FcAc13_07395 [Frischella sp. Ac13]|uniref:Lipoprotein n=1 Tax=Frischella japonica TaxID=2741544 RepID=A0ABR7QY49_9GAMM|nr:hypothetical protein [Frischella japonica]MBC9131132.1 hypothetical protein [Frischella japonica]
MRIIFLVCCILMLSACISSRQAEQAYKKGNYLKSIDLIAAFVEEKGEAKLDANDLTRFRQIVGDVAAHYENALLSADRTNYGSRIQSYEALLKMKVRLSERFFSQQISFFNNKYSIIGLRKAIAEEYYSWGNAVTCQSSACYAMRAEKYQKGSEYYKYRDIETLHQQANNQYMQVAAQEFYELGKYYADSGSFQLAAEKFAAASKVYKPLGKYKDSDQLFVVYDKKYRTKEAKEHFQQAQAIIAKANSRYDYRKIAKLFQYAAEIYQPYGDYQNARALAKQYQQKGIIKVYVSSGYQSLASNSFFNDYYQFVYTPSQADVVINIEFRSHYQNTSPPLHITSMNENLIEKTIHVTNANGDIEKKDIYKTYYFNLETQTYSNELQINMNINVNGLYIYHDSQNFISRSMMNKYNYTGDVPAKYHNYTSGEYLTHEQLYQQGLKQAENYLANILTEIHRYTDQL